MKYIFNIIFSLVIIFVSQKAYPITLNELLSDAKANYNILKEQEYKKDAQFLRYKSSFDPYYPSLDLALNYNHYLKSEINPTQDDKSYYSFSLNLGYKLYDPKRASTKISSNYSFLIEKLSLFVIEKELIQQVKSLYYKILAEKMTFASRSEAFKAAEKTFQLAQAKREVGLAKLSDVYQSKVRTENARLDVVTTKNNLAKLIYEVESLCNKKLGEDAFSETLTFFNLPLKEEELFAIALKKREELVREKYIAKKLEEDKNIVKSDFFPQANLALSYNRYDKNFFPSTDETRVGVNLSWNIFSGMGKYYRYDASLRDVAAQRERIEEVKRNILLDVKKALEDFNSNIEKVKVSEEILKSALETYQQSFEEYRVGKGDILTLLQAEINLSSARENRINSLLQLYQSKTLLERALGISNFEELQ